MKVKHSGKAREMGRNHRPATGPGRQTDNDAKSPRGVSSGGKRLRHDERRAALLRAAKELSVEQGVAVPSLDAIIERAGGSRRSIYTEFGGKEGLRDALMAEISDEILPALLGDIEQDTDLRAMLMRLARNLASTLMSERGIVMSRIIMQDNFVSPARAKTFFARGPGEGMRLLTKVLEAARARGEIVARDCALVAGCFVGMIRGNLYLERVLLLRPPLDEAEIEAHIATAVDIFLDGLKPR
jgi:AcrR family transcriptional regulator